MSPIAVQGDSVEGVDSGSEWWPTPDDLRADEAGADPDLPIVGNVNLSVDLDLSQLNVTPTMVVMEEGAEEEAEEAERERVQTRVRSTSRASAPRETDVLPGVGTPLGRGGSSSGAGGATASAAAAVAAVAARGGSTPLHCALRGGREEPLVVDRRFGGRVRGCGGLEGLCGFAC